MLGDVDVPIIFSAGNIEDIVRSLKRQRLVHWQPLSSTLVK